MNTATAPNITTNSEPVATTSRHDWQIRYPVTFPAASEPFDLLRYIEAAFGPLHGRKPHRADFTRDMLDGGWRPLLEGEWWLDEDESLNRFVDIRWVNLTNAVNSNLGARSHHCLCRTRRALPPLEPLPPVADPYAELKAAHAAGRKVQFRFRDSSHPWMTDRAANPAFHNKSLEFRLEPDPVTVPWNRETCPPLPFEVVVKETGGRFVVCGATTGGAYVIDDFEDWESLLRDYTLREGSPCGTEAQP